MHYKYKMANTFKIICAMTKDTRGIGEDNKLPWPKIQEDAKYFQMQTTSTHNKDKINAIIMGRFTWESLPKPLPNRINIIITSKQGIDDKTIKYVSSLDEALTYCYSSTYIDNIFVIGGQQVFEAAMKRPDCREILLTVIDKSFECDRFFPKIPLWMKLTKSTTCEQLVFEMYTNIADPASDETQYLSLLKTIIADGDTRSGRNGITKSLFGPQHVFDLQHGFPLLTTKRMFFDGIVKELLFFLNGHTNANILDEQGTKIWNGNTSRQFLDDRGLTHYDQGDMGPMYGYNWRHFGYKYEGCSANYQMKGYDQLKNTIELLIRDKYSRRHLMTTYNPAIIEESVLAPCHGLVVQFNARSNSNVLDCKMYQRSVDTALGYPFNIASYALLVHIICHVTGYEPGKLIMTLGDTHLYEQHIEKIKSQINRVPLIKPTVKINKVFKISDDTHIDERIRFIEELVANDIVLENYNYWPGIKLEMKV